MERGSDPVSRPLAFGQAAYDYAKALCLIQAHQMTDQHDAADHVFFFFDGNPPRFQKRLCDRLACTVLGAFLPTPTL